MYSNCHFGNEQWSVDLVERDDWQMVDILLLGVKLLLALNLIHNLILLWVRNDVFVSSEWWKELENVNRAQLV